MWKFLLFLSILTLMACKTLEPMAPGVQAQYDRIKEERAYVKQEKADIRMDTLINYLNSCQHAKHLRVVEKKTSRRSLVATRKGWDEPFTRQNLSPRARRGDFVCVDIQEFIDALRRSGY